VITKNSAPELICLIASLTQVEASDVFICLPNGKTIQNRMSEIFSRELNDSDVFGLYREIHNLSHQSVLFRAYEDALSCYQSMFNTVLMGDDGSSDEDSLFIPVKANIFEQPVFEFNMDLPLKPLTLDIAITSLSKLNLHDLHGLSLRVLCPSSGLDSTQVAISEVQTLREK
jgi:hypothetical protein